MSEDMQAPMPTPVPAPVFVDALNLAYWCGSPPSLRVPVAVLRGLSAHGRSVTLYFDASARHRLAHERALYDRLMDGAAHCVEVAPGREADTVLLRQAAVRGACVLSRDRYRDHRRRHRRLVDDPARLLSGTIADDMIRLPSLALDMPLPASAEAALRAWEALRARHPDP